MRPESVGGSRISPLPADLAADAEAFAGRRASSPGLAELLDEGRIERLLEYGALVHRHSASHALIAKGDRSSIYTRHVLDSLNAVSVFPAPPSSLLDVGSGAGFPGIPLAIVWPRCSVTLLESKGRKAGFLELAVRELRTVNARVICGRLEDLGRTWRTDPVDAVTIRAVGNLLQTLIKARPACRGGTRWVYYAGAAAKGEPFLADLARSGYLGQEASGLCGGHLIHGLVPDTP